MPYHGPFAPSLTLARLQLFGSELLRGQYFGGFSSGWSLPFCFCLELQISDCRNDASWCPHLCLYASVRTASTNLVHIHIFLEPCARPSNDSLTQVPVVLRRQQVQARTRGLNIRIPAESILSANALRHGPITSDCGSAPVGRECSM